MDYPVHKIQGLYRGWLVLEVFKLAALFIFLVFPDLGRSILYYLIFILFFLSLYSLSRTYPHFKFCLGKSIFEEYEPKRLVYARYRNYLLSIMILDIFPILLFPQPILRFIYWRKNRKMLGNV